MALDFPSSPVNGQVYDNFIYDSTKGTWKSLSAGASPSILVSPTITSPTINNAVITATAATASTIPVTVSGAASQSANLQEWKNSSGVQLATVSSSGSLSGNEIIGNKFVANRRNSSTLGGDITLRRASDNANKWSINVRDQDLVFERLDGDFADWQMILDQGGRLKTPYQPAFSAYASAATLDATRTMPYNVAAVNVGGHYNTSTYRFTAPTSGIYIFSMHDIGFAGYTTRFDLMKNGASQEDAGKAHQLRANNTSDFSVATSFWVMSAAAGDYFEVRIYAGRAHGTVEYSWFSGYLLG